MLPAGFAVGVTGTCSGSPSVGCSALSYDNCVQVPGCNPNSAGGSCATAPGGNVNGHTYGWYCRGPNGDPDYCSEYSSFSNGVIYYPSRNASACASYPCTVGGQTAYGCQWTGSQCGGSPSSCSGVPSGLCALLGCTWTSASGSGPTTPVITLAPNPGEPADIYSASPTSQDPDGDTVYYYYQWTANGSSTVLKTDGNPIGSTGTPKLASSLNCSLYPQCAGAKNVTVSVTAWSSQGATDGTCMGAHSFDCSSYQVTSTTGGGYSYPDGCSQDAPTFCQVVNTGCDGLNGDGTSCHDGCGICPSGVETFACAGTFACSDMDTPSMCSSLGCTWHQTGTANPLSSSASKTAQIDQVSIPHAPTAQITSVSPNPATPTQMAYAQVQATDLDNDNVTINIEFHDQYNVVEKTIACPSTKQPYACSGALQCTPALCTAGRNISVWAQSSDGLLTSPWASMNITIAPEPTVAPTGDLSSLIPLAIAIVLSGYAIAYMASQMFNL